jgi:hypothetical protein
MHLLILFHSILYYSILFSSHLFYFTLFLLKSNFSIHSISSYSSSSLTSGMPALDLIVYKASPVVEYSLPLTIKLLHPNPLVKPECLFQGLILHVHNIFPQRFILRHTLFHFYSVLHTLSSLSLHLSFYSFIAYISPSALIQFYQSSFSHLGLTLFLVP